MSEHLQQNCPECQNPEQLDRRHFLQVAGATTAAAAVLGGVSVAAPPAKKSPKPAEAMIQELFKSLSIDQKKEVVLDWDHGSDGGKKLPTRLGMYNSPILGKTIGKNYDKVQRDLLEKILKSISSDEEGYSKITRNGTFDRSGKFENCGALIFGDPSGKEKFSWVFSGHHLTVRCDGNSEEGAAFGGPLYYGHTPPGYSARNCFSYQTKKVMSLYDALDEKQRKTAVVVKGDSGEHYGSIRFRPEKQHPGIEISELSKDQKELVEEVMRTILSPYRKEDADEVMDIIKKNGGMEKINLAFFAQGGKGKEEPYKYWRLEGPGFVWNFRVLPHVHTYVNISSNIA